MRLESVDKFVGMRAKQIYGDMLDCSSQQWRFLAEGFRLRKVGTEKVDSADESRRRPSGVAQRKG